MSAASDDGGGGGGIIVDTEMRTKVPDVYAAGDLVNTKPLWKHSQLWFQVRILAFSSVLFVKLVLRTAAGWPTFERRGGALPVQYRD